MASGQDHTGQNHTGQNHTEEARQSLDDLLAGLRAAGEPTRLRLLVLLARAELTVTELTQILGQSQPRVSRHLKLLCEAGLLDRFREGTWAFYRVSEQGAKVGTGTGTGTSAGLVARIIDLLEPDDATLERDRQRLGAVREARAASAESYFSGVAGDWNRIRSLYLPEAQVEAAILETIFAPGAAEEPIGDLVDIGTGTGRILEIFADRIGRGVGIDASRDMLAIARSGLETGGHDNCQVRLGDMYHLPQAEDSADLVTIHQVLHYADDPAAVVAEAARVLRPGGRLLIVDFAPHDLEFLRDEHAHRRLGFSDQEVAGWTRAAGLKVGPARRLVGGELVVSIWLARDERPRAQTPLTAAG